MLAQIQNILILLHIIRVFQINADLGVQPVMDLDWSVPSTLVTVSLIHVSAKYIFISTFFFFKKKK